MNQDTIQFFLNQGVLGVLVIVNVGVIAYLYKKNAELRDKIEKILGECADAKMRLQQDKLEMQQAHLNAILQVKDEVSKVTERLTTTMDTLVSALTK